MKLIKIIRESIKKNPSAGMQYTDIAGPIGVTFESDGDLPEFIKDGVDVKVRDAFIDGDRVISVKGVVVNSDNAFLERFLKTPGIKWKAERDIQTFHHLPEPDYLYEYETPFLTCDNCKADVHVKDIEDNKEYDYDEGYSFDVCPVCRAAESFAEIEYERIYDVVKELSHDR